jgi:hypothetical protein
MRRPGTLLSTWGVISWILVWVRKAWINMRRPGTLLSTRRSNLLDFGEGKEGMEQHEVTRHPLAYLEV